MKRKKKSSRNSKSVELNRECDGRFKKGVRNSRKTEFKKGQHWREPQKFRGKEYLLNEYKKKKRSASDISREFNVTDAAIYFWLKKHKIPRRSMTEIRRVKKWGLTGKQNGMFGRCGSKNPRWIDGSSPLRQTMYARSFWKELVKTVYKRDEYKCQRCGNPHTTKNRLHAHHIKPWAGNPDSRFELSNITTLCKACHNWVHSKGNIKNEYLSR